MLTDDVPVPDHPLDVEVVIPVKRSGRIDLRQEAWSLALDQRAFGPRRVVVAFADRKGRLRALAHTERVDPPEMSLAACLVQVGRGPAAAIAFCDEPVTDGPPPADLAERFDNAGNLCKVLDVHLVDWIACDDQRFRSSRLCLFPGEDWWSLA